MSAQPEHVQHAPPMGTLAELRAALVGLSSLGLPTYLDKFEQELASTSLDQVPALAERYRSYVLRNTTSEAIAALTMSARDVDDVLRRKIAADR
ncbi:hypothetical protein [Yinghuangia sp. YIM S09857]|uniref:hypothetical protein n=1 Tax=Yinghuangia sp. YIM S09857 TaxID=3436929 RepID=UPI003F530C18